MLNMQIYLCYWLRTVLQGMVDRVYEIGGCYGMEMDVAESKVMRISRQPSSIQIMIDYKQPRMWNISIICVIRKHKVQEDCYGVQQE